VGTVTLFASEVLAKPVPQIRTAHAKGASVLLKFLWASNLRDSRSQNKS